MSQDSLVIKSAWQFVPLRPECRRARGPLDASGILWYLRIQTHHFKSYTLSSRICYTEIMQLLVFFAVYAGLAIFLLFVAIFGHSDVFAGTFIETLAMFISKGCCDCTSYASLLVHGVLQLFQAAEQGSSACLTARGRLMVIAEIHEQRLQRALGRTCCFSVTSGLNRSSKCRDLLLRVCGEGNSQAVSALCSRAGRVPGLAALYITILGASFWVYDLQVFSHLPTPVTPSWHRCFPAFATAVQTAHQHKARVYCNMAVTGKMRMHSG